MFNKKIKNIIFIALTVILISSVSLLNYIIDPYDVFQGGSNWYPNNVSIINIKIKLSKDKKNENLLIGGSELIGAFSITEWLANKAYLLVVNGINYKNYYELLKNYLKVHPETKHVYILLSYASFYSDGLSVKLEEFKTEKLTCSQIFRILFSAAAVHDSFTILYNRYMPSDNNMDAEFVQYYPSLTYDYLSSDNLPEEAIKINYEYINKIVNLLEEKNINYTFFIPPYNILPLTLFYNMPAHRTNIENLKKVLVTKSNSPLYDMAFLNKYTSNDLEKDDYSLYYDYMHPNQFLGIKIFKMLFDNESLDKNTYLVLTKDNINKQIKYENDLIRDYISKNRIKVDEYKKLSEEQHLDPSEDERFFNPDNFPDEIKNDISYINEKVEQARNERL